MDDRRNSLSCMPLFSRVDRLDSTMKYLEGKQNLMEGKGEKQCVPLDLAVREAQFKGSLLDRITWLEQRLHKEERWAFFNAVGMVLIFISCFLMVEMTTVSLSQKVQCIYDLKSSGILKERKKKGGSRSHGRTLGST